MATQRSERQEVLEEGAVAERNPRLLQLRVDRRLGHEWDDWDGEDLPSHGRFQTGVAPFFVLAAAGGLLLAALAAGAVWLLAPRLASLAPSLPAGALGMIGAALLLFLLWLAAVGSILRSRQNWLPRALGEAGVLPRIMLPLERFGVHLGLSRDRVGNSLLRVYNALASARARPGIRPEDLLILLPRCLGKDAMHGAMAVSERYGVSLFVASRGRYARQMIQMRRPSAVVAVACERDLVSGVHDVAGRLPVLGTTLTLPDGPCKNTVFEIGELESQIRHFLGLQGGPSPFHGVADAAPGPAPR